MGLTGRNKKISRLITGVLLVVMLSGMLPLNVFSVTAEANSLGKIVILSSVENSFPGLVAAYKKLQEQGYDFQLKIISGSDLAIPETVEKLKQEVQDANLLLTYMIGSSSYQTVINLLPDIPASCQIVSISDTFQNIERIDTTQEPIIKPYFTDGGPENMRRLLLYLLSKYCGITVTEAMETLPMEARFIYHPDAWGSVEQAVYGNVYEAVYENVYSGPSPQGTFTTFADYSQWYKGQGKFKEGAPWVGIMAVNSYFKGNDIGLYEALLRSLEAKGVNVILTFTDGNKKQAVEDFLMDNGQSRIDFFIAAVGFNFIYGNSQAGINLFKKMNVPIMTPVYADNLTDWQQNPAGISNAVWWQIAKHSFGFGNRAGYRQSVKLD